jgi:hypothetical protein
MRTVYARYGELFSIICCVLLLGLIGFAYVIRTASRACGDTTPSREKTGLEPANAQGLDTDT